MTCIGKEPSGGKPDHVSLQGAQLPQEGASLIIYHSKWHLVEIGRSDLECGALKAADGEQRC